MVNDHPYGNSYFLFDVSLSIESIETNASAVRYVMNAVPYKTRITSTSIISQPTPCRGSTKALPYKSAEKFTVGDGALDVP